MQYSAVAVLALAGAAFANPAPAQVTITSSTTSVVTITTCAPTITNCPVAYSTIVVPVYNTYPAGAAAPSAAFCTGGGACAYGTGANGYNKPTLTGYKGPAFTGAASQVKAGAALGAVGAVAALLL